MISPSIYGLFQVSIHIGKMTDYVTYVTFTSFASVRGKGRAQ